MMMTITEFSELTGINKCSIMNYIKEYGFYYEEGIGKGGRHYLIDSNYSTIFKEIQVTRKELKYLAVVEARRKRGGGFISQSKIKSKEYTAFLLGGKYELFKNDKKNPKRVGFFTKEELENSKLDVEL